MKKIVLFLIGMLVCTFSFAEKVPQSVAKTVAEHFSGSLPQTKGRSREMKLVMSSLSFSAVETKSSASSDPSFYVYNISGGGYVIISGNDAMRPVLGFSDEGSFSSDDLPLPLISWLEMIDRTAKKIESENITANEEISNEWKQLMSGNISSSYSGIKLLETESWHQGRPFNNLAPIVNGERAAAGCTNTALAIIMKYHRYPSRGKGTLPGYYYYMDENYPYIEGHDLGHEYHWEYMDDSHDSHFDDAVSQLCYDLGIMNHSIWGSSTGASVHLNDLSKYFGYSPNIKVLTRWTCDKDQWASILHSEIDNGRPVLYAGNHVIDGLGRGHSFILDGYADNGYYHFNWGWGGRENGYYTVEVSPDWIDYSESTYITYNIKPAEENEQIEQEEPGCDVIALSNTFINDYLDGKKTTKIEAAIRYLKGGSQDLEGRIAIVGKDGKIREFLSETTVLVGGNVKFECALPETIARGYKVKVVYKNASGDWVEARCSEECTLRLSDTPFKEIVSFKVATNETKKVSLVFSHPICFELSYLNGVWSKKYDTGEEMLYYYDQQTQDLPNLSREETGGGYKVRLYDCFDSYEFIIKL